MLEETSTVINHSDKRTTEKAEEIVVGAEIEIGDLKYTSNWIVSDCRYDILLGMPWNVDCSLSIDCSTGESRTGNLVLPPYRASNRSVKSNNFGVKKSRSLPRKIKNKVREFRGVSSVIYQQFRFKPK